MVGSVVDTFRRGEGLWCRSGEEAIHGWCGNGLVVLRKLSGVVRSKVRGGEEKVRRNLRKHVRGA